MFKHNKVSLTASFISLFSVMGVSPVFAADINFDDWSVFGDVITDSMGETSLSTNALADDDFDLNDNDSLFNFSGNAAIDSITLEGNLGINFPPGLDPDFDNFVQAFEGSGLTQTFNFLEPTTVSFDFTFLTNDETFNQDGFDFDDYAFVVIDGTVIPIAGTFDPLVSSTTNYQREISGRFSQTFQPGTIQIGLGVVDVGDFVESSALVISNAQTEITSVKVNEPSFIGGLLSLGIWIGLTRFSRRREK